MSFTLKVCWRSDQTGAPETITAAQIAQAMPQGGGFWRIKRTDGRVGTVLNHGIARWIDPKVIVDEL